jgi:hypothetical protein
MTLGWGTPKRSRRFAHSEFSTRSADWIHPREPCYLRVHFCKSACIMRTERHAGSSPRHLLRSTLRLLYLQTIKDIQVTHPKQRIELVWPCWKMLSRHGQRKEEKWFPGTNFKDFSTDRNALTAYINRFKVQLVLAEWCHIRNHIRDTCSNNWY